MTYSASVEWLCGHAAIVRLHPCPNGWYGDPYVWCATVARYRDTTAVLKGVLSAPPHGSLAVVYEALRGAGFTHRAYARLKADGAVLVSKPLR